MDYKLKRIAALIVSLAVLSVLGIVVLANLDTIKRKNSITSVVSTVSSQETGNRAKGKNLDAWKSDETFFDNDKNLLAARILEEMKTLSLKAFSVERDLRIRILDYEGNLSSGTAFTVSLKSLKTKEEKTYTDDDSDGFVSIVDLEPGDYEILLLPEEGFNVPETPLAASVKGTAEYSVIEDISLFLKKEGDIDKEKENLMSLSALDYADKKQKTTFATNVRSGVDVSSDNKEVDWVKVYDSGIRFVMLRAGYRGAESGELIADEKFADNARKAYRAGLDVGAYFFSQAVNEREAVEEASALCVLCSGLNINYPLCIRLDRAGGSGRADGIDEETRTKIAEAFCKTVKGAGYEPFVYASGKWLTTNLVGRRIGKYGVWLAEFKAAPSYEEYYDMWQYSSKGKVPGIDGEVGLNISYIKESE